MLSSHDPAAAVFEAVEHGAGGVEDELHVGFLVGACLRCGAGCEPRDQEEDGAGTC